MPLPIRAVATRFDPRRVGSLGLWVDFSDASTVTLDTSSPAKVSQVNDKSGNGRNMTQTTASDRFVLGTINGLTCADFGTAAASTVGMNFSSISMFEAHLVLTAEGHAGNAFDDYNALLTSSTGGLQGQSPFNRFLPSAVGGFGTPAQLNATSIADMDSTGNQGIFPTITSPCVFQMWQTSAFTGVTRFGNDRGIASRAWKGRVGEVLVFTANLNDDSRRAIRRYLAYKWQITAAIP